MAQITQHFLNIEQGSKFVFLLSYYKLHSKLRENYGERIGIYSIGPAGEYMMRAASIAANDLEGYPSRQAARGGLGAVMGSKRIKAIIIFPAKKIYTYIQNQLFRTHRKKVTPA